MSNHLMLSDIEIFEHSKVRLIFLGQTKYGILHEIKQPSPGRTIQPAPANNKPASTKKGGCKATCRSGTCSAIVKRQGKPTHGSKARTLSELCSQQYGIPEPGNSTPTGRSRCRSWHDIDYLSLNGGPNEDVQESPKHKKRVSYHPNRKGPSAGRVAAQCVASPENSPKAVAMMSSLKGVQTSSEVVPLPTIASLTGVLGTPENLMPTGEDPNKLLDLGLTLASNNDGIINTENRNVTNIEP